MNNTKDNGQPLNFTDEPNAVTIRITGAAFKNLKEIADIFNAWDNADNTPADIVKNHLCESDGWKHLAEKNPQGYVQTLAGGICSDYDEAEAADLAQAFKAAGFSVEW